MQGDRMFCICIENKYNNTNFTQDKIYEMNKKIGVRCDWGDMWCHFEDWNRPTSFDFGSIFEFGLCKFKIG